MRAGQPMKMTQQDYEARHARRLAGQASDDDLRLIGLYERNGYSSKHGAEDGAVTAFAVAQPTVVELSDDDAGHGDDWVDDADEGDECPGNSSERSPERTRKNSEPRVSAVQRSARTTGRGSKSR